MDATNQWLSVTPNFVAEHLDIGGSELVASLAPGSHVIKAFDNMYGPYVAADPVTEVGNRILFYAGDDEASVAHGAAVDERRGIAGDENKNLSGVAEPEVTDGEPVHDIRRDMIEENQPERDAAK